MSDRRYTYFWKKTHCSFVSRWMGGLVLWLFILTACVGEELQKPLLGEGEGYLTLQVDAISAEVTSDPLTKATLENLPAQADFAITIKDASGSVMNQFDKLSEIKNPLVLKAGVKYTVEAFHGANDALQETPYFYGSSEVTIQANTNNPVTVTASLGNAMITPIVSESLKQHYNGDWTLEASAGGKTLPLASAAKGVKTLYARAREIVSLTFAGTNKAEQPVSFTWTATGAVEPCTEYKLQCDPDLSAFNQIEVKATATHTTDASGYLNGTDVVLISNLNGANEYAIQSWTVNVLYNEQVIRTYSGSAPPNLTMTQTDGWPYIPQGSTLSASVKLMAGDEIAIPNDKITLTLPEPDFGVAVSAYTSYDKYKDRDITAANNCLPETMYDIKASAKISQELLDNTNYSHSFQLMLDGDVLASSNSTNINAGNKDGLSWASHTLKAVITFGGSTYSMESVHHITGLPYTLKHPANSGKHPWYIVQSEIIKFTDTYILLTTLSPEPTVGSSAFHIPDNTLDFQLNCSYHKNTNSWGSYTFYIELLNPNNNNRNSTICSHKSNAKGDYTLSNSGTFSPSYPAISCRYGYNAKGNDCNVNSISINYR